MKENTDDQITEVPFEKPLTCPHCQERYYYDGNKSVVHICVGCGKQFNEGYCIENKQVRPNSTLALVGTPEDNEKYHAGLIYKALQKIKVTAILSPAKDEATFDMIDTLAAIKDVNQLLVNTTSLVWIAGIIERLEEIERECNQPDEDYVRKISDLVDTSLHKYHADLQVIQNNIDILEHKMNLP